MYLGVDIGGTKTLVASFSEEGGILEQVKFPTPQDYEQFISDLAQTVAKMSTKEWTVISVAVPGFISREEGIVHALGNLPWREQNIRDDISAGVDNLPVIIENDAKLAGLAEAVLLDKQFKNLLYLTISTGIGGALLKNDHVVKELEDAEMGKMPLWHEGAIAYWEDFAGGRAIVKKYGKQASEIDDPKRWEEVGNNIAYGLGVVCSVLQPDVIVFGGGAGQYADKFKHVVDEYLEKHLHPVVRRPEELIAARRKDMSSLYGCYEIAKQYYGGSSVRLRRPDPS